MSNKVYLIGFVILMSLFLIGSGVLAMEYSQAPELQQKVDNGTLPALQDRLPEEPLVLDLGTGTSADKDFKFGIGQYGGTFKYVLIGMSDITGAHKLVAIEPMVRYNPRLELTPNVASDWEVSDDYTTFTFHLRKGIKWSDGVDFTSKDVLYFFNHVIKNKQLTPAVPQRWKANGKIVEATAPDKYTVVLKYESPKPLLMGQLGSYWAQIWQPQHYLKQYHPDFVKKDKLDQVVENEGYNDWAQLYEAKQQFYNVDLPQLQPWVPAEKTTKAVIFKRNPYYWKVDKEGKQLPYLDEMRFNIIQGPNVAQMKAISGELTMQARHMTTANYPLYMKNRDKGNYHVGQKHVVHNSNLMAIKFNLSHPEAAKRELFMNDQFRKALSIAIDRQEILDVNFAGFGEPAQNMPNTTSPVYVEKYVTQYTQYQPEKANKMLDEIGLTERDDEGFRLGPDGKKLTIVLNIIANSRWSDPAMMLKDYWGDVGIRLRVKEVDRSLMIDRAENAENDMYAWWGARGDAYPLYNPQQILPFDGGSRFAAGYGRWYRTDGEQGVKPPEGSDMMKLIDLWDEYYAAETKDEVVKVIQKAVDLHGKNLYDIGIARRPATPTIISNKLRNRPDVIFANQFVTGQQVFPAQWWLAE